MTRDTDGLAANSISASAFAGPRFAFGFCDGGDEAVAVAQTQPKRHRSDDADRPVDIPSGVLAQTAAGEYIRVDWERSSTAQIFASGRYYAPGDLRLPNEPVGVYDADLWLVDTVFDARLATFPQRQLLHYANTPLTFEPGLGPLCWPLQPAAFCQNIYNRRAWVVHAGRHRLHHLRAELAQFDVDALIGTASRTVGWLRDGGAMQYVDVESAVLARALYRAGHSLYFNPDLDVQRRYVKALAADLGMDFGATAGGDLGGDIEMFAVRGAHRTPWHYDAQHNFTVQLSGTKRWSIKRGPITDPISNLHPHSTNRESVRDDVRVHGATCTQPLRVPNDDDQEGVYEFTLRPGSVLYLPAGWWHKVEQLDADTPSLSMNFSIDGARWADLFINRLLPLLWADPAWRARPDFFNGLDPARSHLQSMLDSLSRTVSQLKTEDVLPQALLLSSRQTSTTVQLKQFDRLDAPLSQQYRRSPLVYLVQIPDDHDEDNATFSIVSGFGKFADGVKPEFSVSVVVPKSIESPVRRLISGTDDLNEIASSLNEGDLDQFQHFVDVLVDHGYLIQIEN